MLYFGRGTASPGGEVGSEANDFPLDIAALQLELKKVQGELEVERTQREMDRRALELVRQEMAAQREQAADLEEDLRFYRSLMAPEGAEDTISARIPEIVAKANPGQFAFRIVIQQEASKHAMVAGVLSVEVSGFLDGQALSYPLAELSDDLGDGPLALKFLYFQAVDGDLTLPPGFEPKVVTVLVNASKPRIIEVRKQFPWQLQERFTHVGK
jgi:hypothetical protein